jgi:hypothetical protein
MEFDMLPWHVGHEMVVLEYKSMRSVQGIIEIFCNMTRRFAQGVDVDEARHKFQLRLVDNIIKFEKIAVLNQTREPLLPQILLDVSPELREEAKERAISFPFWVYCRIEEESFHFDGLITIRHQREVTSLIVEILDQSTTLAPNIMRHIWLRMHPDII